MKIRQISVFIENQSGRIYEVTRLLGDNGLNIRAMSLADTSDFGIIRFIVTDPVKAHAVLKEHDFTVSITDVVAIAINDTPGGLADLLDVLQKNNINVEYMYAFVNNGAHEAVMVFRFEDTELALAALKGSGVNILEEKTLLNI
jgi:hypothetical protein